MKTAGIRGIRGRYLNVSCECVYAPPKKIAERLQHGVLTTLSEHGTRNGEIASRSIAAILSRTSPVANTVIHVATSEQREQRCGSRAVPLYLMSQTLLFLTASYSYDSTSLSTELFSPLAWAPPSKTRLHLTQPLPFARLILVTGVSQYRTTVPSRRFDQQLQKAYPQTGLVLLSEAGLFSLPYKLFVYYTRA